jgi:hypothetical protein
VALLLLAIFVDAVAKAQNPLLPRLTGWKTLPASVTKPRMVESVRAVGVFSSVESPISRLNNRTTLPPASCTSIGQE